MNKSFIFAKIVKADSRNKHACIMRRHILFSVKATDFRMKRAVFILLAVLLCRQTAEAAFPVSDAAIVKAFSQSPAVAAKVSDAVMQPTERPNRQKMRGGYPTGYEIIDGDTVIKVSILPVYVFRKPKDMRRYQKLVRNVKIVYPYAKQARAYLDTLEAEILKINNPKERARFAKAMEKEIVRKYRPVLEQMTFSQGKILIKLIDRETERTSYQILKQFRGGFVAGFWQTIARIFKANLKDEYDKEGDDQLIEQIIILYEAGLL